MAVHQSSSTHARMRRPKGPLFKSIQQARGRLARFAPRALATTALLATASALAGCKMDVLDPAGPIAAKEKSLILLATWMMLIVVIPVIAMTVAFAWRYRASNKDAAYEPEWEHSNRIELVVWLVPCFIVGALAVVCWTSTHELDPFKRIQAPANVKPIEVDVVSLDWKWLFIYPEQKVASVNQLALPAGVPVRFRLTSATVMNSFFIPRLGSQIYTMPGMETKLSLLANAPGAYDGISANYSGDGFSDMKFTATAMTAADFDHWVQSARASQNPLTLDAYRKLAAPSERLPAMAYGDVDPGLYHDILNQCADGSVCMDKTMAKTMNMKMTMNVAGGDAPKKGL